MVFIIIKICLLVALASAIGMSIFLIVGITYDHLFKTDWICNAF